MDVHLFLITFGSILIQFVTALHFRQDDLLCLMQLPWCHNRWRCKVFLRFQWDRLQWLDLNGLRLWLLHTVIVAFFVYHFAVIVWWIRAGLEPFVVDSFFGCHSLLWIPSANEKWTKRNLVFCREIQSKSNESKTYSKHLLTKSTKSGSLHRSTCANGFVPGFRLRFFEFVMHRGFPRESKNRRRRDAWFNTSSGGTFSTSIMHANCSTSFSPGNIG